MIIEIIEGWVSLLIIFKKVKGKLIIYHEYN